MSTDHHRKEVPKEAVEENQSVGHRPDSANKSSAEDGADPSTSTDVPDVDNRSEISFDDFYIHGDSSSEDEEQSGTLLFEFFDSPPSEVSS